MGVRFMTTNFVKVLSAAFALGALLSLDAQTAMAKGGGGGGHGGAHGAGVKHFGGGKHFSGATYVRGLRGSHTKSAHVGKAKVTHISKTKGSVNRAQLKASRSNLAHVNGPSGRALRASAVGGKAAWSQWGNPNWRGDWYGGWGGWSGPVFWPYFFGNLLAFTFWPYGYYAPFWGYGNTFVWDAIFWPGPYYAYGPTYYDVYGGYGDRGQARTRVVRRGSPEITGSTSNRTELAQSCGGLAPGVTDFPIDRVEATIRLSDEQLRGLDALKAASSQASDILKRSCSSEVPQTPLGRLDAVENRINGMMQALEVVRTPLDSFYSSLNEEQRERFAALGQASARTNRRGSASGNDLAALCSRHAEGFTQLPAQRVEQIVKPTQQQLDAFDKLKSASMEAANQLQASCPAQMPKTPLHRFDVVGTRLNAMENAIKKVRPALASFYDSLSDEQKARFNTLGPPRTAASRQG